MRTSHLISPKMLLAVAGIGMALSAHALPSDANQPIRLLADKATYSESTGVTNYLGNVIIEQGTLKITADNITLNLDDKRSIKTAVATVALQPCNKSLPKKRGLPRGEQIGLIIMH